MLNPIVLSVSGMSMSIVLGMHINCRSEYMSRLRQASDKLPLPPIKINASSFKSVNDLRSCLLKCANLPVSAAVSKFNASARPLCKKLPARRAASIGKVLLLNSMIVGGVVHRPSVPSWIPMVRQPRNVAPRYKRWITVFKPEQSPPVVIMPIFFIESPLVLRPIIS